MAETNKGYIAEYYLLLSRRLEFGNISEEKHERLVDKLVEWAEYAERISEGGN